MIEVFQGSASSYVMSVGDSTRNPYDFSDGSFNGSPVQQYRMVPQFLPGSGYDNIFVADSTSIIQASSSTIFTFIHESGATISDPYAVIRYEKDYILTDTTAEVGNPIPQKNRRASFITPGGIIINN